ncbi:MAG: aspartyl protease family protein [Acidobacteriota bacterium]
MIQEITPSAGHRAIHPGHRRTPHPRLRLAAFCLLLATSTASLFAQGTPAPKEPASEVTSSGAPAPQVTRWVPGPLAVDFPADRDWIEVPFRLDDTKIILPLRINDTETVQAVLDTGASSALLLDHEIASRIDFNILGVAQVAGAGGGGDMPRVEMAQGVSFGLGDLTLNNASLAVMRGPNPMARADWQAIVGRQIFDNLVVTIDWSQRVLRLADPATFKAPAKAVALPIERERGHIFVKGDVSFDGEPSRPVRLVVDSGAFHALSLDARKVGPPPPKKFENVKLGRGLGGIIRGSIARLASLRLGPFAFQDVVTRFPQADVAGVISSGSDGNLGAEVLRRFQTTFDYSRDRMLLEPNGALDEPFRFSTAGIGFFPALTDDGAAQVDDVYARSPAARAGLREGDEILRLDGKALNDLGLTKARGLLQHPPGTQVALEVRRDGQLFELTLELEELL